MAGEVALEAADGFAGALAFAASSGDVVTGSGWQRARVTMTRCRAALIWRLPPGRGVGGWCCRSSRGSGRRRRRGRAWLRWRVRPRRSRRRAWPRVKGPNPGWVSSSGAIAATRSAISRSSALIVWESSRMRRSSSRAMRTRIVCCARDPGRPAAVEQRAAGQLELGARDRADATAACYSARRAGGPAARGDRRAAAGRARARPGARPGRSPGPPAARRGRHRSRRSVGLPALASALRAPADRCVGIRNTRSPRPIKKRSRPPETCRQSSSAQTRSPSRPRAHRNSAPNPRRPT